MTNRHQSIDGFSIRRRTPNDIYKKKVEDTTVPQKFLKKNSLSPSSIQPLPKRDASSPSNGLRRNDIDESLKQFTDSPKKKKKNRLFTKKRVKRLFLLIFIILLLVGGYVAIKAFLAGSKIFGGNLFDIVSQAQPLKEDEFGRSNIAIFGTSEDDQFDHDGATLTDSILLVSVDQKKKTAAITSVPRDLWVEYDDECDIGYQGKINAVYQCALGSNNDVMAGSRSLRKKVGEVYGLDVQYSIKVGYKAVQQAVDAVGGVDIVIESEDPRGILDRNFDWECRYQCYYVKYPNGPAHLDGKHALALARARNDAGGYGLSRGNFDREINQQKILLALQKKAISAGTLANPVSSTQLIDSLGNNVRTNFVAGEIKTLVNLGRDTKQKNIDRFNLVDQEPAIITTGSVQGQSVVRPVAGILDYSEIALFIRKRLASDAVTKENATIMVLNGSGRAGAAQTMKDQLTSKGLTVSSVGNAPVSAEYGAIALYKVTDTKQPATTKKLESVLKTKLRSGVLPYQMQSDADFVVIVGQ